MISKEIDCLKALPCAKKSTLQKGSRMWLQTVLSYCGRETAEAGELYSHQGISNPDVKRYGSHAIIQLTLAGKGCLEIDGEEHLMRCGDVMVLLSHTPFHYYLREGSPGWEFCFITPTGGEALRFARMIQEQRGVVFALNHRKTLQELHQLLRAVLVKNTVSIFDLSVRTYAVMTHLLEFALSEGSQYKSGFLLKSMMAYIKQNFTHGVSVQDVADAVGRNRTYISKYFHRAKGETLVSYITSLRLNHAENLLMKNCYSIKEVAFFCGFNSISYFCKAFQKQHGCSPGRFYRLNRACKSSV